MCTGCADSASERSRDGLVTFTDNYGYQFAVDPAQVSALKEYRSGGNVWTQIWVSNRILFIVAAPPADVVEQINQHRADNAALGVCKSTGVMP
jgi:hypothetical protein